MGLRVGSSRVVMAVTRMSVAMKPPVAQAGGCHSPAWMICHSEIRMKNGVAAVMQFVAIMSTKKKNVVGD